MDDTALHGISRKQEQQTGQDEYAFWKTYATKKTQNNDDENLSKNKTESQIN